MIFHANLIEIVWLITAAAATGGTLHVLYLTIEHRAMARLADKLHWTGSELILQMAEVNLWTVVFRFVVSILTFTASGIAVFSMPGNMEDIAFFPQILSNIVIGISMCFVLIVWAIFDLKVWNKVQNKPA